jgi:hypothetical protein
MKQNFLILLVELRGRIIKSPTQRLVKILIPESQLKKSKNIFLSSNKKEINEGEIGCTRLGLSCF